MRIDIRANLDQIRFFARSALHAFDFQSPVNARATVVADMEALLEYLAAFDDGDGVAVATVRQIEGGIALESIERKGQVLDLRYGNVNRHGAMHARER